jgi:hypothetical protein
MNCDVRRATFQLHKCSKTVWRPDSARTRWGSSQRSPDPLLVVGGPLRGGGRRRGEGKVGKEDLKGKGREGENGREGGEGTEGREERKERERCRFPARTLNSPPVPRGVE